MNEKLKAIWHILQSKSFFYVARVGDNYKSHYDINGVQPKGMLPAETRVDIMFAELERLTLAIKKSIENINYNYHNPRFIDEYKDCHDCTNWGTKDCPNSAECYSLKNKPYYKAKRQ